MECYGHVTTRKISSTVLRITGKVNAYRKLLTALWKIIIQKGMHCSEFSVSVITFDEKLTPFLRFVNYLYWDIEDLKLATRTAANICPSKNHLTVHIWCSWIWFKLAFVTAKEFVDCCADFEVVNCPVNVWLSGKWYESTESGKLGASCVVLLRMTSVIGVFH